jgi:hypothetical protein
MSGSAAAKRRQHPPARELPERAGQPHQAIRSRLVTCRWNSNGAARPAPARRRIAALGLPLALPGRIRFSLRPGGDDRRATTGRRMRISDAWPLRSAPRSSRFGTAAIGSRIGLPGGFSRERHHLRGHRLRPAPRPQRAQPCEQRASGLRARPPVALVLRRRQPAHRSLPICDDGAIIARPPAPRNANSSGGRRRRAHAWMRCIGMPTARANCTS